MLPHLAHRAGRRALRYPPVSPSRLTAPFSTARHPLAILQHAPRQHQRPGRGIDQGRGRVPQMRPPFDVAILSSFQGVHRGRIGTRAAAGLGQAHQRDPPLGPRGRIRRETLPSAPGRRSARIRRTGSAPRARAFARSAASRRMDGDQPLPARGLPPARVSARIAARSGAASRGPGGRSSGMTGVLLSAGGWSSGP